MPNFLSSHKRSVASQHGEDGIIEAVFQTIGATNKWCVEFGAVDGRSGSNTWNLIKNHGWSAVLIESHPGYYKKLSREYEGNQNVAALNLKVDFQGDNTLDNILARANAPKDIDFVSIDIDGADYHIWDALKTYRPRVVMIECNLRIPPSISFISPRDLSIGLGSSLKALVNLGKQKGYELVYAEDMNTIFVLKELFPKFAIPDNSPEKLGVFFEQEAKFFQALNGSLVLYGIAAEHILLFKKKPNQPCFVMRNGELLPVPFRGQKILRGLKQLIKRFPLYYTWVDPLASRIYGRRWREKRTSLRETS